MFGRLSTKQLIIIGYICILVLGFFAGCNDSIWYRQ